MVGPIHLLIATVIAASAGLPTFSDTSCTAVVHAAGLCTYGNAEGPSGVRVGAQQAISHQADYLKGNRGSKSEVVISSPRTCGIVCRWRKAHPNDRSLDRALRATPIGAVVNTPARPAVPATPPRSTPARIVTAQDVAHFLATAGTLHAEPDGWAVVGVPANYWIDVESFTVDGTLLGNAAQVRFTPVAYVWDYGDGTARTTTTGGSSWSALGQQELTATPTSHVFRTTGTRTVRVTVAFTAEYRLGAGPWTGVTGEVSAVAPGVPVRVVVERTLLTATG